MWQQFQKARVEWKNCVTSYNTWAARHKKDELEGAEARDIVLLDEEQFLRFTRTPETSDKWLVLPEFDGKTWPWPDCAEVDRGLTFITKTELLKADQHHKRAREDMCLRNEEIVDCHHTVGAILAELAQQQAHGLRMDVDPRLRLGWREGVCREEKRWSDIMRGFGAWNMEAMRQACGCPHARSPFVGTGPVSVSYFWCA